MATDCDMTVPDDGPSVSIVEIAWGTVLRTRNVVDLVAAVGLRRAADSHWVDLPDQPSDRLPPAIGGRGGMGSDRSPLPLGDPVRIHPAAVSMPHPRRPGRD